MAHIFNLEIPLKEKPVSRHPWDKTIKSEYTQYKYGHITAKNPITNFPRTKEKPSSSDQIKFTVIGNRLTEEFIYCSHLVKGLHRFRGKSFGAPVILGLSSVEWKDTLRDLKIRFGAPAFCLQSEVAVLMNDKLLGGMKALKHLVKSKYAYYISPDYYKEAIDLFANYIKTSGRPCAYMQIAIDEKAVGTLIFMLYSDIVPRTCENFLRLCTEKKGGYSGTPIHRIVKDCWIQGGGFGLKSTDLDCENFIVPHDKRGVLCMANDGRHVDCSTQFFVLLQPAPWMASKYVAFGKLIDGEQTLKQIEAVETWWESPKQDIIIYQCGLFNMDCQYMPINKNTNEYIQGHIENLAYIGKLFCEIIMEKVNLTIELREIEQMEGEYEETEEPSNMRSTQRFIRRREEIEKQLQKTATELQRPASPDSSVGTKRQSVVSDKSEKNNEYDVDNYTYEPEEYTYTPASSPLIESSAPEIPYYIPLTDVLDPGDASSEYNLHKMMKGDYCLEGDLDVTEAKLKRSRDWYQSEVFELFSGSSLDSVSLSSEDERQISMYFKDKVDRISFAGAVIRTIAKTYAKTDIFKDAGSIPESHHSKQHDKENHQPGGKGKLDTIEEEDKKNIKNIKEQSDHKQTRNISMNVPAEDRLAMKFQRRQTAFITADDLALMSDDEDDKKSSHDTKTDAEEKTGDIKTDDDQKFSEDIEERKVRISSRVDKTALSNEYSSQDMSSLLIANQSALNRLFMEGHQFVDESEAGPTLKDYRPSFRPQPSTYLTYAPMPLTKDSDESIRHRIFRRRGSIEHVRESFDQVLDLQHGTQVNRKFSSDYVRTIERIEKKSQKSIRTIEFAKTRPTISVKQYREKNQKYREEHPDEIKMPPVHIVVSNKSVVTKKSEVYSKKGTSGDVGSLEPVLKSRKATLRKVRQSTVNQVNQEHRLSTFHYKFE